MLSGHDNTNVLSLVEVYDPALPGWSAGPSLTSPRAGALAVAVNGTLFIMGGSAAMNGEPRLATVEALNRDGTWSSRAPMPVPMTSGAVAVMGDTIYVVGGNSATGAVAFLQAYHVASNQWTLLPPMPEPRHGGHSAEVVDGKLYVIGGWFGRLPHDDVFVFDPRRNAWRR